MIYTPQKDPNITLVIIFIIASIGIIGGMFIHPFCIIFASTFWLLYTTLLSFQEFEKKKRHHKGPKAIILNPQLRFFIFEFLAFIAISATVKYSWNFLGSGILLAWLFFSINYHNHLKEYAKYE